MSNDKFDPTLSELLETTRASQEVDLIIGLSKPASDEDIKALTERGLNTRSIIGDIITGSASTQSLSKIAELKIVLKIEMSRPMDVDHEDDFLE